VTPASWLLLGRWLDRRGAARRRTVTLAARLGVRPPIAGPGPDRCPSDQPAANGREHASDTAGARSRVIARRPGPGDVRADRRDRSDLIPRSRPPPQPGAQTRMHGDDHRKPMYASGDVEGDWVSVGAAPPSHDQLALPAIGVSRSIMGQHPAEAHAGLEAGRGRRNWAPVQRKAHDRRSEIHVPSAQCDCR
jgi:hypothetical protein